MTNKYMYWLWLMNLLEYLHNEDVLSLTNYDRATMYLKEFQPDD